MNESRRADVELGGLLLGLFCIVLLVGGVGGCMGLYPSYHVWEQEKLGQASYAMAESTRKIAVLEAQAKFDSAKLLAQAEVERAKGVAQANQIIGDSLKGNEVYLHYLWINNLHEGRNDVIYIPTEAGIPIMEAGRATQLRPAAVVTPPAPKP
jgi:hypothetical protein